MLSRGLTATPLIHALPVEAPALHAGRLPVMSIHPLAGDAVGPLVVRKTLPNQLPVMTVLDVVPEPTPMVWMKSAWWAPPPVPVVRSTLAATHAPEVVLPAGRPPVVVR